MEIDIIEKTIPINSKQSIITYYISFSNSYNKHQNKIINTTRSVHRAIQNKIINTTRSVHPAIQKKMQMVFTRK